MFQMLVCSSMFLWISGHGEQKAGQAVHEQCAVECSVVALEEFSDLCTKSKMLFIGAFLKVVLGL